MTHDDPADGKHFVVYDDGEKKCYTMTQKTFWVIGDNGTKDSTSKAHDEASDNTSCLGIIKGSSEGSKI